MHWPPSRRRPPTLGTIVDGWMTLSEGMGVYGNAYLRRAVVTLVGLGANPPEDAVYPMLVTDADGQPLAGENDYVIHFDAGKLPPVDAFWSVTMYDAEGYQVANEIDRFAIGDRDALQYNADGSLDLYLQHSNPGPEKLSNWLPAPLGGTLGVTMRLYAPAPRGHRRDMASARGPEGLSTLQLLSCSRSLEPDSGVRTLHRRLRTVRRPGCLG